MRILLLALRWKGGGEEEVEMGMRREEGREVGFEDGDG